MFSPLCQRRSVPTALYALAAAFLLAGCTGPLAGDILSGWSDSQMLTLFDTDGDGTASTRELRKGLSKIIVKVASQDAQYDLDGDGTVARADIKAAVVFIRESLQANCGNGRVDVWEECDDANTESGDGCSGVDHPNGACTIEHCGDSYVDTDGVPDPRGNGGLSMPIEQCDDGGKCIGGTNDGKPCTSFGGFVGDRQCPGGSCGMFSFDGCQNNCLLEICGNGTWEGNGMDGKPGKAGIDDDNNGMVDDDTELWALSSDDEQCDPGGVCMKNGQPYAGYTCTPGGPDDSGPDACRQNGGVCTAVASATCTTTCERIIPNLLSLQSASADQDGAPIPSGTQKNVGVFRMTAASAPQGQNGYQVGLADFMFTVDAPNVSIRRSSIVLQALTASTTSCTALNAETGAPVTSEFLSDLFLVSCPFSEPVGLALGTQLLLHLKMDVINSKVDNAQPSRLQVSISRLATADKEFGFDKSHIRWIARNGPQSWQQFRLQPDTDAVSSTLYGDLPSQCGDGLCQQGENAIVCAADCVVCGNGTREADEQCDDGNVADGDKCTPTCTGVTLLDHVKAMADTNHDGAVSDAEALAVTFDILDADTQPYQDVQQFDVDDPDGNTFIDGDGDVDDTDVGAIIGALDTLAP